MGELTLNLVRLGVIVLLWAFVFSVVGVLRGDLYGTRVLSRSGGAATRPREVRPERRRRREVPTHLVVTEGRLRGTSVPLHEGGLLIGRNPECTLVLTDDYASGRHLRIYPGADAWYADDLGSTNGTLVNGQKIGEGARLDPGAQIRIGQTVLELRR
ncbi:FHA domain-containing protein FhaB/FipA [Ornithinimicrobium avium]|uniref:FHA domain-containing protein n=1 Tax=Ornithinimicrobium avium TaxID=2283195 RepID=A0A345NP52_9MICO|nr:FHA domain-containing protein [Ornithinimicrobium avium]AXH96810.1 FHA domain-containing protein [Ornithinimicrobium avium]